VEMSSCGGTGSEVHVYTGTFARIMERSLIVYIHHGEMSITTMSMITRNLCRTGIWHHEYDLMARIEIPALADGSDHKGLRC
jgi:hypothetical protein